MPERYPEFNPSLPLARASTIPSSWYSDGAFAVRERSAVFANSWQCVGRAEQVARPGSFLTAEVAGEPLLVVRGQDGELRGFFNVCRHRAAPLETSPCGTIDKLRCRYHGWTYDLAGRLKGTPEFDGVEDFNKEENGLVPLGGVEVWGPFVWARIEPPTESLAEVLDPLPEFVRTRRPFEGLHFFERKTYDVNCNWKVYVDNYLDGGYHVNTVHPALAGVLDYREYTTTIHGRTSLQSSPLTPSAGSAGETRIGDLAAYWWIWPDFMINIYTGVMDTNWVLPLGIDRCRVTFDFYFADGTDQAFAAKSIAVADEVQAEDVTICEEVQRGLGSRYYSTGRFAVRREIAGYHFHRLLAEAVSPSASGGRTGASP